MRVRRRGLLFVFGAVVVALVASSVAWADNYKFRFTAADQAAARRVVLQRADLGTTKTWKGGLTKADLSSPLSCPNYHPKLSDLVVTGAAESHFSTTGLEFENQVVVLQTARMVRLDWQRSLTPAVLSCLSSQIARGSGGKLVSASRIAFPHLATYTAAFRIVLDITDSGQTVRVLVDAVLVGRGRTEMILTAVAPAAGKQAVAAAEVRLARILVGRISV